MERKKREIETRIKEWIINNQKKAFTIIIVFMIFSALGFTFSMVKLIKENSECVQDPFTYVANRIIIASDRIDVLIAEPVCKCDIGPAGAFYFDKEGIYKEDPRFESWGIES